MTTFEVDGYTDRVTVFAGRRLLVGEHGKPRAWVTITTVFGHKGRRYVMTCGHARGMQLISGETRGVIAELAVNMLAGAEPIDMALYRLTDPAVDVLRPSYHASSADNPQPGAARVYTAHGRRRMEVFVADARPEHLQARLGSNSPLIACDPGLDEGDSGAPLHQLGPTGARHLVGLLSGGDYSHSYFTPVRDAIVRALELI